LAHSNHVVFVREVEKAAAMSGAPFLAANAPLAEARVQCRDGFPRVSSPLLPALLDGDRDRLRQTIRTMMFSEDRAAFVTNEASVRYLF
jgi:hypothetical protein